MGEPRGNYDRIHPNDHVNLGQSTNDVFPTAMRLSVLRLLPELLAAVGEVREAFSAQAEAFRLVVKSGRTHLQDAVPVTLGQEFGGYAAVIGREAARLEAAAAALRDLGIGGSATGTGLNTHPGYREQVVEALRRITGLDVRPAENLFAAMQSLGDFAAFSAQLRNLALELSKIANDLRLLSSGPRTGLAEIKLPAVQPGSSIMPGKVNPVLAEMLDMVCYQVIGCDQTVALAAQAGQLELNVMMPVVIHNLLFPMDILRNALRVFARRCVAGIEADAERCRAYMEQSVGLATALTPIIGYKAAAALAQESERTGKSIRQLIIEKKLLPPDEVERLFDPRRLANLEGK